MKKIIFSALLLVAASLCFSGCMEADPEFVHTDDTISSIYCVSATVSTQTVAGVITEGETSGEITFKIPAAKKKYIDITKCKLKASIGLDAFIEPALTGYQDISGDGLTVEVVQKSAGTRRTYIIKGSY